MKQGGGLMSFLIKAKEMQQVEKFCDSLKRFTMAVSWGGHESLMFPTCALYPANNDSLPPWNLVRIYTGLEDAAVLIDDIEQALEKV